MAVPPERDGRSSKRRAQVRAEEALRVSEARLRAVIEHGSDGFALLAADGTVLDMSALGARILGVPRDEIVGKRRADVLHPDDAHAARRFERVAMQAGCSEATLHRVRHADGSWRWIEGLFTNLLDDAAVAAVVFNYRDVTDRKHAEERLAFQAQLIEVMRDAVVSTDADRRITSWNPAAEAMYGWKAEEVLGRPASEVIPSHITEIQREEALRALAETGCWSIELTQDRRDGSPVRVEGVVIARRDAAGRPTGYVAVNRDASERHAAREAVRESEQRFTLFMDHLPGPAFIKDDRGRYVYMNDLCRRVLGTGSDWRGRTDEDLGPVELARQFREADDRVRVTRAALQIVERVPMTPDGRDWLVTKFPIPATGGGCSVGGIAIDITERERADEALRRSEQRYRDLFEQNVAGVLRTSLDGAILEANDAGARIFGFASKQEFAKRNVREFWRDPRDRASMIERLKAGPVLEELLLRDADGRDLVVLAHIRLVLDADGEAVGLQGTLIDITERKRAEQALQEAHDRLAKTVATAPGVVCSFRLRPDGSACFPHGSERIAELYGVEPGRLAEDASAIFSLIHPDDVGRMNETVAESARSMNPWRCEWRVRNPARGELWLEGHSMPVSDPDGSTLWHGIVTDVTERKRGEAALVESERHYHTLFDAIDEGFCVVEVIFDEDGKAIDYRFLEINPSFEKHTGLIDAQGKRMRELAPKHEEHWFEIYGRIAVTGQPARFVNRAEQLHRWYDVYAFRVGQPEDRHVAILFNDITERKQAEEALRESETRFRKVFEESLVGIVMADTTQGQFREVNAAFCQMLGYTEEELKRLTIADVTHPEHRGPDMEGLKKLGQGQTPRYKTEKRYLTKKGETLWATVTASPVRDDDGRPLYSLGMIEDITERKRAEEKLRALSHRLLSAQEEERRRIARELHDQIGQVLTAVKLNLESVARQTTLGGALDLVPTAIGTVDQAIGQVRSLSLDLRPSILDDLGLPTALRWYVDRQTRDTGIEGQVAAHGVEARLPPELETACFRVVQEAVTNVLRHARAKGVWVELRRTGDHLELRVRDDGAGFDLAEAQARAALGTCMGLSGMQERVSLAGGRLEVTSAPGAGTQVVARFPVSPGAAP
jgi:PAS domain S-box-containing protein